MDCSRARTRDPAEWIRLCPSFSRPLAEQVQEWILTWEPDLTESIKWNMLCFSGRKLVCGVSACQRHLGLTFFRGIELPDPARLLNVGQDNAQILSLRLTTLEDFPREALRRLLRAAVALDADPTFPPVPRSRREPFPIPDFFAAALAQRSHQKAAANFQRLAPSCQREYLVWLASAKRPETRARRLQETLAALQGGRRWAEREPRGKD